MINVCVFNGDMSRGGGTERITQILANSLASDENYNVFVLNLNNPNATSYYPLDDNINFVVAKRGHIVNKIICIRRFLKVNRIDVIINVDIMLGIYTLPASFWIKTKMVSWEMFNIRNDIGSKNTDKFRKICLRKSAYYVNLTKSDMEAFINEMPVKCPITYIYNPCEIDLNYTDYDVESKIIATAGHFFYTKGFDLVVPVAKFVFDKHPDWKWHLYGDGIEMENVKESVSKNGLENNVIFCGRTNSLLYELKKASMYVMTSRNEGFGLVLTEAKSCNLPTIAYDVDFGPREIIDNGVSGYLVDAFDAKKMANCICELIENKDKRIDFSNKAKDNCSKFSLDKFVEDWKKVINEIME